MFTCYLTLDTLNPSPVPPAFYTEHLLLTFSGDEYATFLHSGGRQLRPRLQRALQLAAVQSGMRVLDIGCGRGEVVLHLARRGARITAVDFSPDCLRLTTQTLDLGRDKLSGGTSLTQADATSLPFANASFDRVLLLDVAEHLQPWQLHLALREMRRVLRPGAYAVIHTLPNRWALDLGYPLVRRLWPGLPAEPRSGYERSVHVNELDPVRLAQALQEAGLQSHVWLENWTVAHAQWGAGRRFRDRLRDTAYPLLCRPAVRAVAGLLMRTPLRLILANDLFAVAWPAAGPTPARAWPRAWSEQAVQLWR